MLDRPEDILQLDEFGLRCAISEFYRGTALRPRQRPPGGDVFRRSNRAQRDCASAKWRAARCACAARLQSRTTTSRSVPDSAPHASPGRPSIWRTEAARLLLGKLSNFSVTGSKRTMALAVKSVSQTLSLSST
jgi:hypothetical protein